MRAWVVLRTSEFTHKISCASWCEPSSRLGELAECNKPKHKAVSAMYRQVIQHRKQSLPNQILCIYLWRMLDCVRYTLLVPIQYLLKITQLHCHTTLKMHNNLPHNFHIDFKEIIFFSVSNFNLICFWGQELHHSVSQH